MTFLIAGNSDFMALTFVPLCRLHSGLIATNYLGLLNHILVSISELGNIFEIFVRVIEILKFCTQTGSVRNRVAWTELALYGMS